MDYVSDVENMCVVITERCVVVSQVKSVVDLTIAVSVVGLTIADAHDLAPGVVGHEGDRAALLLPTRHEGVVVVVAPFLVPATRPSIFPTRLLLFFFLIA